MATAGSAIVCDRLQSFAIVLRSYGNQASDVLEPLVETGNEHFACQESGPSQIFKLIVSTSEKTVYFF